MRRLRLLYLDPTLIVNILQKHHEGHPSRIVENSLPNDARFMSCSWRHDRQCYVMCVESSEFDPVPEGEMIPEHPDTIWETIYTEKKSDA